MGFPQGAIAILSLVLCFFAGVIAFFEASMISQYLSSTLIKGKSVWVFPWSVFLAIIDVAYIFGWGAAITSTKVFGALFTFSHQSAAISNPFQRSVLMLRLFLVFTVLTTLATLSYGISILAIHANVHNWYIAVVLTMLGVALMALLGALHEGGN